MMSPSEAKNHEVGGGGCLWVSDLTLCLLKSWGLGDAQAQ